MPPLFVVQEPVFGVPVRLEETTWFGHVLPVHKDMRARRDDVRRAIASPSVVLSSKSHADRYLYHLLLPGKKLYVRVVVRLRRDRTGNPIEGVVVTAYLTDIMSGGDVLWVAPRLPIE
ncbi:MAG: hypothetical protein J7M26_03545 [Armatimonadetes bacterium]|nr:hypothetical protein [Armatimonadota bacterium]